MRSRWTWIWTLVAVSVALLGTWIARNTYWDDLKVPMPPKGEALVNPFYATQRFAGTLGARTSWDRSLVVPSTNAVIVLSGWHWSVGRARRAALEQWVEAGGRLVVDDNLIDPNNEFEEWSGIVRTYPEVDEDAEKNPDRRPPELPLCRQVREQVDGAVAPGTDAIWMCDLGISWLKSQRTPAWALTDKDHIQAMRVRLGRGSVTVINTAPFRYRKLFDGDHGRLFVAATQFRRGDEVHFMSEDDYPGLLTLMWRRGAPAVAIGLVIIGMLLWRGAVRLGPLAPAFASARRSLADQIRGSGRFALQYGDGRSLHAACVRALDEAARRRISGYASLEPNEQSAALARVTSFDRESLAAAIHHPRMRTAGELHRTIALLEAARRETLKRRRNNHDGTR
jgi:hypothetical protein